MQCLKQYAGRVLVDALQLPLPYVILHFLEQPLDCLLSHEFLLLWVNDEPVIALQFLFEAVHAVLIRLYEHPACWVGVFDPFKLAHLEVVQSLPVRLVCRPESARELFTPVREVTVP